MSAGASSRVVTGERETERDSSVTTLDGTAAPAAADAGGVSAHRQAPSLVEGGAALEAPHRAPLLHCGKCGGRLLADEDYEDGVFVTQLKCIACGQVPGAPARPPTAEERRAIERRGHHQPRVQYPPAALLGPGQYRHTTEQRERQRARIADIAASRRAARIEAAS